MRFSIVSHSTRHATMHIIAIRFASLAAVRSRESSARHPDFITLWNISIFHRSAYQSNFSIASALHATGRLVTSFHRIGSRPSGVPRSVAWITVSSNGP